MADFHRAFSEVVLVVLEWKPSTSVFLIRCRENVGDFAGKGADLFGSLHGGHVRGVRHCCVIPMRCIIIGKVLVYLVLISSFF